MPRGVGSLDWNLDTDEIIPLDLARAIRKVGISVDIGAYEVPPASTKAPPP